MKKLTFVSLVLCLILVNGAPAKADGRTDLFNEMLPESTIASLLDGNWSHFCEGTVPEAIHGKYAGRGDQDVAFSLLSVNIDNKPHTVMVFAWKYRGKTTSMLLEGTFKQDGDDIIFKSSTGTLKIEFDGKGGGYATHLGERRLSTKIAKID